jgi:hypothetical protein
LREVGEVAVQRRKVVDALRIDEGAEDVLRLDERGLPGHCHILLNGPHPQHEVDVGCLADAQHHARPSCGREAGQLDRDFIGARRQTGQ